jgi:hypothetical protein
LNDIVYNWSQLISFPTNLVTVRRGLGAELGRVGTEIMRNNGQTHYFVEPLTGIFSHFLKGQIRLLTAEHHATMESCSDKFHVGIPNVA